LYRFGEFESRTEQLRDGISRGFTPLYRLLRHLPRYLRSHANVDRSSMSAVTITLLKRIVNPQNAQMPSKTRCLQQFSKFPHWRSSNLAGRPCFICQIEKPRSGDKKNIAAIIRPGDGGEHQEMSLPQTAFAAPRYQHNTVYFPSLWSLFQYCPCPHSCHNMLLNHLSVCSVVVMASDLWLTGRKYTTPGHALPG